MSKTAIIIPIKRFDKSKTRLSPILDVNQRKELTELLILDMLEKIYNLNNSQIILVSGEKLKLNDKFNDVIIINDNNCSGVNEAIELADKYIEINEFDESLIIPIDLPLFSIKDLKKILKFSKDFKRGICIVPSQRMDGTNLLLRKPNSIINTYYDNNSFYNHIKAATNSNNTIKIFTFERLMIDLDTMEDIITLTNIYNRIYRKNRSKKKFKESKSIEFLNETISNNLLNI
ncbi:MAG TPA: 2-phospho-L-lactate guanylyltransferase [Verrucomicrobiae bacterium]|nr:2-phospho-L-lactate guanylyltransferase [Verrucomicrobiae bacterium]